MAIYAPGKRDRHNKLSGGRSRNVVAMLSLTAMVDMFTVLVVFLLQNYNTTGEVIELSDQVILPQARAVKELRPAHVVIVSRSEIELDHKVIAKLPEVQAQDDWKISPLFTMLADNFRAAEEKKRLGISRVKKAVDNARPDAFDEDPNDYRRVTVQADKTIDFLTIKKVMYTITEAGAAEINFAVMKTEK